MGTVTTHAATKTIKHTIKNNQTLYTIAHKNHTTIEAVRKANHLKKGDVLKLGRVLTVPVNTYFPNKKKKTTLAKIAKVSKTSKIKKPSKVSKRIKSIKIAKRAQAKKSKKVAKSKNRIKVFKRGKKSKRTNRRLRTALTQHAAPFSSNRIRNVRNTKTDDILFMLYPSDFDFSTSYSNDKASKIIRLAKQKLGTKYVWGAVGQRNTFDCSGLTKYVYEKQGINIPRTSYNQAKYGESINRRDLKPGDLIFFDTSKKRKGYVNHVGIYIGNGEFLHASSAKKKVVITSLNAKFYSQRYRGARRPS